MKLTDLLKFTIEKRAVWAFRFRDYQPFQGVIPCQLQDLLTITYIIWWSAYNNRRAQMLRIQIYPQISTELYHFCNI